MDTILLILNSFKTVLSFIFLIWWLWLPVVLFLFLYFSIQNYTRYKYLLSLEWVLLEIKVPKEVSKSPKAMEQVFAGLHGVYSKTLDWKDTFIGGKVLDWYSLEMVGKGGETHFYIRAMKKYRNIVEAQIYAQYPDAEIMEVPDYINELPTYLPNEKYDLWGAEFMLTKEDAYPIRTYPDFEEKGTGPDDAKRIDPLASLSELFSTLKGEEQIWIQFVTAPVGDGWIKRGQAVLDKMMGKEAPAKKGDPLSDMVFAIDKAITGLAAGPTVEKKEEKEKKERVELTPGKHDIMKAIEKSWDKLGFETSIRFMYIGPKDDFHQAHTAGVSGAFRQFSSQNLNGFRMNKFSITYAKGFRKRSKLLTKKQIIYQSYRVRNLWGSVVARFVLNTEELATIFHFPDTGVKSPLLPRVEAKKGEPPVGLPIT